MEWTGGVRGKYAVRVLRVLEEEGEVEIEELVRLLLRVLHNIVKDADLDIRVSMSVKARKRKG